MCSVCFPHCVQTELVWDGHCRGLSVPMTGLDVLTLVRGPLAPGCGSTGCRSTSAWSASTRVRDGRRQDPRYEDLQ